ncbi:O-antigen ligase family protein [Psychromonas sp. RZ22]|uniref:O-antigen ligase family protein n=1 Tax=Psychromonas algarum TaxID=2555643 RepID=UPI001067FC63|nr:O-antigen ligase family protein [Psychromonas sp. RZ22]TEW56614.1 O-antigen ligase family protein [Psychromonas sp. RZ22]
MTILNKKNILNNIILLPILWVFTGMFLYPGGKKMIVILVLISTMLSFYTYGIKPILQNIKNNRILWLLGAYCIFSIFAKMHYGYGSSSMRALLCLFIFLAILPPSLITKINFKYLVLIGTITSFIFVMVHTFIFHQGRMWSINPIPYATFSATLSILSFYYLLQSRSIRPFLLWITTFVTALIPLLYSQSRGLWFALIIAIIVVVIKSFFNNKKSVYLLIPFLLATGIAYYFSHDRITQRITQTEAEIHQIQKGNLNTSIGLRLQMWKTAIILSQKSPIIGLGNEHIAYKKRMAEQHLISPRIVNFTHYHNQFLTNLVKYGIIGLALLILTIILPAYYLKKNNNENTWPGLLIISIYSIASLTDVPFQHAQTLTLYFILTYLLIISPPITKGIDSRNSPMRLKKLESKFKSIRAVKFIKNITPKKKKKTVPKKDYSYLNKEVLSLIKKINAPIFPMFGTLLSIYRDKEFIFADDYDFALLDKNYFSFSLIEQFSKLGCEFHGFSTANNEIIELTFKYKGVSIDVFYLQESANSTIHLCPNFRTQKPQKLFTENLKERRFSEYFSVKYSKIVLQPHNNIDLLMPLSPVDIFLKHYGKDWETPKKSNFIDFNNYSFISGTSSTFQGKPKDLLGYIKKYELLRN